MGPTDKSWDKPSLLVDTSTNDKLSRNMTPQKIKRRRHQRLRLFWLLDELWNGVSYVWPSLRGHTAFNWLNRINHSAIVNVSVTAKNVSNNFTTREQDSTEKFFQAPKIVFNHFTKSQNLIHTHLFNKLTPHHPLIHTPPSPFAHSYDRDHEKEGVDFLNNLWNDFLKQWMRLIYTTKYLARNLKLFD